MIRNFYPIGPQKVRMALPISRRVRRVEILRAEKDIPFRVSSGILEFTVPTVASYEVASIYCR